MAVNPPSVLDFIRGRQDWRAALERDYGATSARLQAAYQQLLPELQRRLDALTGQIGAAEGVTAEQVRGARTYRDLIARIEAEMDGFARLAANEAGRLADNAVVTGIDAAFDMAAVQVGPARRVLASAWVRPDPAALRQLVNYIDSPALRGRVAVFGERAAAQFGDTLLALVAQGQNPQTIARRMTQWLNLPYTWADNTVRTAQLWSYRAGNHGTFRANDDILDGWLWSAALDTRTCLSCVAQHGTVHPTSEILADHHRGRCAPIGIVKGTRWVEDVQTGEDWFNGLPEAQQRQMMGPGLHDAWRRGQVDFRDLSQPYHDDVYGTMLRQATAKELGVR